MAKRTAMGNPFDGQIPTVSATAAPVDIYQQGVAKRNPLSSLSDTLKSFSAKASPVLKAQEQRMAKDEFSRGLQLYNDTRKNIGEAVKDGVIAESDSPFLRKGYRVGNLNVMAARYAADLDRHLEAKKLYHSGDPAKIEAFVEKYYEDFKQKNPLDAYVPEEVSQYFGESVLKANEALRTSWLEKHRAYASAQMYQGKSDEINAYVSAVYDGATTQEDYEVGHNKLKLWLETASKEWENDGLKKDKLNQTLVDSVIMTAIEEENLEILDLLGKVKVGTGFLGSTAYARAKIFTARDKISSTLSEKERVAGIRKKAVLDNKLSVATTGANVAIISYFNNGLKPEDKLAFESNLKELVKLGVGGDLRAGKLVKSMTDFYVSEEERYQTNFDERRELDPAEMVEAYTIIEGVKNHFELYDKLRGMTDSTGVKLSKPEVKQLLDYGLTKLNASANATFDLTDSTSSANQFLGQLEDLYPKPKIASYTTIEGQQKVEQAHAYTMSIMRRSFQNRYLKMYHEKRTDMGAEPTPEMKHVMASAIFIQMQQLYVSAATRTSAVERLNNVVPDFKVN